MPICQECEKNFYEEDAEREFEEDVRSRYPLNYNNLTKTLCGDCAISAFESESELYKETCERCNTQFEPLSEERKYNKIAEQINLEGDILSEGLCCAACAIKKESYSLMK